MSEQLSKTRKHTKRGNNEGSIYKRENGSKNSAWAASITIHANGKAKRKTFYGPSRQAVADKLAEVLPSVRNGLYKEPSKITFSEWLDNWLNNHKKNALRISTFDSYKTQIEKHIKPNIGHIQLSQLATSHLQQLYNNKLVGNRADSKQGGLSARSVRYIHVVLDGALKQALRENIIQINPADAVTLPKQIKPNVKYLNDEQVAKFLAAAQPTPYFTAYYLELATGLRRGELLGLRWKNVDLANRRIFVTQSLIRTNQGLLFQEPKTKLAKRTVAIPADVAGMLEFHRARQKNHKDNADSVWTKDIVFLLDKPENNDLVFTNEIGKPTDPRALTRHFERLLKKAGLPNVSFHGLRHTYATMCLQEGVDIKSIQVALGHYSSAFTLDIYSAVTETMQERNADKIGNLLTACLQK